MTPAMPNAATPVSSAHDALRYFVQMRKLRYCDSIEILMTGMPRLDTSNEAHKICSDCASEKSLRSLVEEKSMNKSQHGSGPPTGRRTNCEEHR